MCFGFSKIGKIIDDQFSLQSAHSTFNEAEFNEYKIDHAQRLLDNFFDFALIGISAAFIFRIVILSSKNAILDLIWPFVIFSFIAFLYFINKKTTQMKHYFHMVCIPIVGLLTARKTISQNSSRFFLNESFASWLIMMMFGAFSSTQQWYKVVAINFMCFFLFITIIFRFYGIDGVGNDFYIHITTTIIFSATLIRMNEVNLRNSFNLLSTSKIQEKKWQSVLTMLTDGVLIMQHTESDKGILLVNPSLYTILGNKQTQGKNSRNTSKVYEHTCGQTNLLEIQSLQNQLNESTLKIADSTGITGIKNLRKKTSKNNLLSCSTGGELQDNLIGSNQDSIVPERIMANMQNQFYDQNLLSSQKADCKACQFAQNKQDNKKQLTKNQEQVTKRRFNEKRVGPIFDELFRTIRFKIIFQGNQQTGDISRHTSDPQFLNDFICKQMEFFKENIPSGYSERLFLKVLNPRAVVELHMIKLDSENQVLFLFKEVSVYNKLSKARTTEKFSNILINSIAHNLFTPLNVLIQLNKNMSELIEGENQMAEKNVQMIGICLQQLVFTTHNILEMSKIRQGRFKPNSKEINVAEKLNQIFDFFKDDLKFREIEFEIKKQEVFDQFTMKLDDARFIIILYNLVSNSVKHTNGGVIKASLKILDEMQMLQKKEKYALIKKELQKKKNNEWAQDKQSQGSDEQSSEETENSESTMQDIGSTLRRNQESSEEDEDEKLKKSKTKKNQGDQIEEKLYLSCSITDSGVGMNQELKRKCFTLFGNLKFKKEVNQGGMGLGLASANLICKSLGGELNLVWSEEQEGSKFNFIITVQKGKEIGLSSDESSEDSNEDSKTISNNEDQSNKQSSSSGDNFQNRQNSDEDDEIDDEEGEASCSESIKTNSHDLSSLSDKKQRKKKSQYSSQYQSDQNKQRSEIINTNNVNDETSEKESNYSEEGEDEIYSEELEDEMTEQTLSDNIENQQINQNKNFQNTGLSSNSSSVILVTQDKRLQVYDDQQQFFQLKNQFLMNNQKFMLQTEQRNAEQRNTENRITEKGSPLVLNHTNRLTPSPQKSCNNRESVQDSFVKFLNNSCSSFELQHSQKTGSKQKVKYRQKLAFLFKEYQTRYSSFNERLSQQKNNNQSNVQDHNLKNPFFAINNKSDKKPPKEIKIKQQSPDFNKQKIKKNQQNKINKKPNQLLTKINQLQYDSNKLNLIKVDQVNQGSKSAKLRYEIIAGSAHVKMSFDSNNSLREEIEEIQSHISKIESKLGTNRTQKEQKMSHNQNTSQQLNDRELTDPDIKDLSWELNLCDEQLNIGGLVVANQFSNNDVSQIYPDNINPKKVNQLQKTLRSSKGISLKAQSSQFKKEADIPQSSYRSSRSSELIAQPEFKLAQQIRMISKASIDEQIAKKSDSHRLSQNDFKILVIQDKQNQRFDSKATISDRNELNNLSRKVFLNDEKNQLSQDQKSSKPIENYTIKNNFNNARRNAMSSFTNNHEKPLVSAQSFCIQDVQTSKNFSNSPINSIATANENNKKYNGNYKNLYGISQLSSQKMVKESDLGQRRIPKQKTMMVIQPETLLKKRKTKKVQDSTDFIKKETSNDLMQMNYPSINQLGHQDTISELPHIGQSGAKSLKDVLSASQTAKIQMNKKKESAKSQFSRDQRSSSKRNDDSQKVKIQNGGHDQILEKSTNSQKMKQRSSVKQSVSEYSSKSEIKGIKKANTQKKSQSGNSLQDQEISHVLIVDDTVFNLQILQMIFQTKYKLLADQAVSGEEAIMKCKQRIQRNMDAYRFIVMDINMPGMDGVVATSKIREFTDPYLKKRAQKEFIIVAHTAIPQDQFGNAQEKGFDGFLKKPIDIDQLYKFLKKVKLV